MARIASYLFSTTVLLAVSVPGAMGADPLIAIVTLSDSYINDRNISGLADRFSAKVAAGLLEDGAQRGLPGGRIHEQSSDALRWLQSNAGQKLLANPAHNVLILETAQNACRVLKLDTSKANLDQIVAALSSADISVLIMCAVAYDYCRADYVAAYPAIFSDVATKYDELLYPDYNSGIEGRLDPLQYGRDHPNAAGEGIIAANILSSGEAVIARAQ